MRNISVRFILAMLLVASAAGAKCIHEKYPNAQSGSYTDTYTCKDKDATGYIKIVGDYEVVATIRNFDYQETLERVGCGWGASYFKRVTDSQGEVVWHTNLEYPDGLSCRRGWDKLVTQFKNRWKIR